MTPHTLPVFAAPQWKWRRAQEAQAYGFVSNRLVFSPQRGRERECFVVVPTEFFQLLPVIFPGEQMEMVRESGLFFYMDQEEREWVFGVETQNNLLNVDLWPYIPSKLLPWMDAVLAGR